MKNVQSDVDFINHIEIGGNNNMTKLEAFNKLSNELNPLTITSDRYCGAYSGGNFTAWFYDFWNINDDIDADDVTCQKYW